MTEDLVRDLLSEQARGIPVEGDLLGGVARRRRDRRRRRLRSGGIGLAVVLVVAAVGVTVGVNRHSFGYRPAISGAARAAARTYPAGTRPVTWAGIQLDVPAAWTTALSDPHRCADTDEFAGGEVDYSGGPGLDIPAYACNDAVHPVHERLELGTDYSYEAFTREQAGPPVATDPRPVTFGGYAAQRVQVGVGGQVVTYFEVPQLKTDFTLTTNTSAEASAIVDTAHPVSTDENGCAVDQSGGFPAVGSGSAGPVLSLQPVGGTVCSYADGRLQSGVSLDAANTAALAGALGRLPASYTAAQLQAQRTDRSPTSATLQLTLRDADGRVQDLTIEAAGAVVGVAGRHTAALTQELRGDLYATVPSGFLPSYPDDLIPAGCAACAHNFATPAPPPTRPVTYRGITLNVPATWAAVGYSPCLQPGGYVETITSKPPGGLIDCPALGGGSLLVLGLSDDRYEPGQLGSTPPTGQSVLLAGMTAVRLPTLARLGRASSETLVILLTHAMISVSTTTPAGDGAAVQAAILATARPAGSAS